MTDLKISQFVNGGTIDPQDEIATNRAGVNTKVFVGTAAQYNVGNSPDEIPTNADIPTSYPATDISYDNSTSGLTADNVQAALDEVVSDFPVLPLDNFTATADPTVNDDETDGYSVGSKWYNSIDQEAFLCVDASTGAAVWIKITLTVDELGSAAFADIGLDAGEIPAVTDNGGDNEFDLSSLDAVLVPTPVASGEAATKGYVDGLASSGTYTPTLTPIANIDSIANNGVAQWQRIGNIVTVYGSVDINPTAAAGANTTFGISLPIASNLANTTDLHGLLNIRSTSDTIIGGGGIVADTTNDRATAQFGSGATVNRNYYYTFSYIVI